MVKLALIMGMTGMLCAMGLPLAMAAAEFETDEIETSTGELKITFIGHASLIFDFGGKSIYVDPDSHLTDFSVLPKADMVLFTHEHRDHCDSAALQAIRTDKTVIVSNEGCAKIAQGAIVMRNGDARTVEGLRIAAVPAYNLVHMRSEGAPFHPKGVGNGYVVTFGDKKVYVAGDTENIPEMKNLKDIDIAFLPMNLPYTMTPEMTADAALSFKPKVLYPYHFGDTDVSRIVQLLEGSGIEVRLRRMK